MLKSLVVASLFAIAYGAPQGYNYNPGASSGFSPSSASLLSSALSLPSGLSGLSGLSRGSSSSPSSGIPAAAQLPPLSEKAPIVSKRFYLHSAPEDEDEDGQEKNIDLGPPQKNYNVVFIKAPSSSKSKQRISVTPSKNEDKTVIYVLTKKTDASDIQTDVKPVTSEPSKPEVFFIKYKTPEEAVHAQHQIQAQYDALGGTSQFSDEGVAPLSSVVGSVGGGQPSPSGLGSSGLLNSNYLPPN